MHYLVFELFLKSSNLINFSNHIYASILKSSYNQAVKYTYLKCNIFIL